ncbi:hypothetical protein LZ198_16735 [Myxococcus sp. K15C18031901]|uniref:hypothetical protein n=1 Tax=Myxococcus dinghuensis TaxID=2906761 RepID=UPI0020A808AD|nr:hypothetical protein [Myxococcus dinghuensis]MCP3100517.1 hypothetical protein [Myxococcus dinghuensis]
MTTTMDLEELLRRVRSLLERDPTTKAQVGPWVEASLELIRRLKTATPEVHEALDEHFYHYLSDGDIRGKDPAYREAQLEGFREWLAETERKLAAKEDAGPGA